MSPQSAGVHRLSPKFSARVVRPGGLLYHGVRNDFSREPASYERGHAIIEIYDARHTGKGFSPIGQFVSSYSAEILAASPLRRLSLQGGISEWTMDEAETAALVRLAKSVQP